MKFLYYILFSFKTLLDHKLRSFLTTLGIIFGVSAVIVMTAIGEGAKKEALAQIKELGISNIYIKDAQSVRKSAFEEGQLIANGLDIDDYDHLTGVLENNGASKLKESSLFVQSRRLKQNFKVYGVGESFASLLGMELVAGRWLHPMEVLAGERVVVLSENSADLLFENQFALGQQLRLKDDLYTVVGVGTNKSTYPGGVFVPFFSGVLRESSSGMEADVSEIIIEVRDIASIHHAASWVKESLVNRHNGVKDFEITIPDELLRQQEKTQDLFNNIMILITAISLLVGGIGIMNIMLASVLERTKEIGVRRGMGATKKDIQDQFLAEAVVLTSTGGLLGVVVGVLLTFGVEMVTGWDTSIPMSAVLISIGFSIVIGVVFGFYPAKNASELNVIDALRYE